MNDLSGQRRIFFVDINGKNWRGNKTCQPSINIENNLKKAASCCLLVKFDPYWMKNNVHASAFANNEETKKIPLFDG